MDLYEVLEMDGSLGISPGLIMHRALYSLRTWEAFIGYCKKVMDTKWRHERAIQRGVVFDPGDPVADMARLFQVS